MFENYKQDSTNSKNTTCVVTSVDKNPLEVFNAAGKSVAFSWHHGDSITFTFDTTGTVLCDKLSSPRDAAYYFENTDTYFLFTVLLMKTHEVVFTDLAKSAAHYEYSFSSEESEKVFKPGLYRVILELVDADKTKITQLDIGNQDIYVH